MKLGAERKKVGVFVALVIVAVIVYWINSTSDAPQSSSRSRPADPTAAAVAQPAADGITKAVKKRVATGKGGNLSEFVPKSPDAVDPSKVDPTLRLDLLAKVQAIDAEGGVRNLFQFCMDCAAKEAAAAAAAATAKEAKVPKVEPIHPNAQPTPPLVTAQAAPPPAGPPPTPSINLKYYGYSTKFSDGEKKAFFLDGDDVIVAAEGEIIKKQYKVVRINVNSVQMEDTASKSTQTLPMQQDAPV